MFDSNLKILLLIILYKESFININISRKIFYVKNIYKNIRFSNNKIRKSLKVLKLEDAFKSQP